MATKQTSINDTQYSGDSNLPLYDFFIELQQNGFSVTPNQISDASKLIDQFANEVTNESELASYLTPLFANNQEEQIQFNEIFNQYFHLKKNETKIDLPTSKAFKSYFHRHWWKYLIGVFLLILFILFLAYQSILIITPSFRLVDKNNPESSDFIEESFLVASKDILEVDIKLVPFFGSTDTDKITHHVIFDWGDGTKQDLKGEHQYQQEGIYELKAYITFYKNKWWTYHDTIRKKVNVCNQQAQIQILNSIENDSIIVGQKFVLKADIIGPRPDSIAWYEDELYARSGNQLDTIIAQEGNYYISCKAFYGDSLSPCHVQSKIRLNIIDTAKLHIRVEPSSSANPILSQKKLSPFWLWLTGGLTLLTLGLTILFSWLWNRSKKRANQVAKFGDIEYLNLVKSFEGSKPPLEVPFHAKNYLTLLEPDLQFIARQMRKRMSFDENVLNIPATIQKSIKSGGLFQPVSVPRTQQSEFLFLIDESNKNSLQVKLLQYLIEILIKQNVLIDTFYFRETPFNCYNSFETNGISLEKLSSKFGHHVLIFCGKGDQLLYEHYPILNHDILQIFSRWRYKAILTPVSFLDWGNKEINILLPQVPIAPLDTEGIINLLQIFYTSNNDILSSLKRCMNEFYSLAQIDFENIDELETFCKQFEWANIKDNDENVIIQWLGAMAVYPKIKWELMIAIGKSILSKYEKSSELNYSNLLLLSRIKWVSDGQFPDYTRLDLLKKLKPENEVLARETILDLLAEITIEELNPHQFAYEEKEIQRITNEFNLYAFDSVKYIRYKQSKEVFENLWRENKLQDSPAKVYFKNPSVEWQNLIQDKDDIIEVAKSTMPLEKYFAKGEHKIKPQNKIYYYLSLLSGLLLLGSFIGLVFFLILKTSDSNKFPSFFEPKTIQQKISFAFNDPSSVLANKSLNCYIDTISFELKSNSKETRLFNLNDSVMGVQFVVGDKTVLDTMMKFEFDSYNISVNQPSQVVHDSNLKLIIIRPDYCNDGELYMDVVKEFNINAINKDSVISTPESNSNLVRQSVTDCLNAISFGSKVDKDIIEKLLQSPSQAGIPTELKIVSPSDFPIHDNEIQIYVKAKKELPTMTKTQYDLSVFLSDECEQNKKVYQNILEETQGNDKSIKNIKFVNIGRSSRKNISMNACVNYITSGKKVDQKFVSSLVNTFKNSGIRLIQKPTVEHSISDEEVLIYYFDEFCNPDIDINLNEMNNSVKVKPLQKVKVTGTYSISNMICEQCVQQLIIGIGSKPIICVYDGIPAICPKRTNGTINFEMEAPEKPGNYDLYMNNFYEMKCNLSNYKGRLGRMAKKMATIIVESDEQVNERKDTATIIYSKGKDENRMSRSFDQSTRVVAVKFETNSGIAYSWSLKSNSKLKILNLIKNQKESFADSKQIPGGRIYDVYYFKVNGTGKQNLVFEFGDYNMKNNSMDNKGLDNNQNDIDNFILDIEITNGRLKRMLNAR